jgi:dihydrofolate reductase
MLSLIVCFSQNRVIGHNGKLPWHYKEDLKHFKKITMGHTLIMGRKTYQSLTKKLTGRKIIVVTNQKNFYNENCSVAHSLTKAVELAGKTDKMPFICGGAEIYKQALPFVQKMYITEINKEIIGDTFFPEFNENEWKEIENRKLDNLTFRILNRIKH